MTHKFIVNTEDVNEYGYRVLTEGIDYKQYMRNPVVLFMHERGDKGNEVIGRCTKLYKEDGKLIAEIEFDTEDEFAKQIAGKVERGYIRMASIYADIKASSSSAEHILEGQIYETVTACKLVEISIVDIGGNDNALKLSKDGKPFQLNKLKTEYTMNLKTIALALGMSESTKDEDVLKEVQSLKLAKENAERRMAELESKQKETQTAEATGLVEKAVALGLIPEGLKVGQIKQFESDFEGQKAILSKLIADKEAENHLNGKAGTVRTVVLGKGDKPTTSETETFDYLQKHDPVKLGQIREQQPEEYARLAKEYANGVRYTKN